MNPKKFTHCLIVCITIAACSSSGSGTPLPGPNSNPARSEPHSPVSDGDAGLRPRLDTDGGTPGAEPAKSLGVDPREPTLDPPATPNADVAPRTAPGPAPVAPEVDADAAVALTLDQAEQAVFRIEATGTFATPLSSQNLEVSGGTGFVIDDQGYALTNAHVVSGATLLRVQFPGDTHQYNAQVVALSECSDLALMKLESTKFGKLEWQTEEPSLGTKVLALGYPLGGDLTLTSGIVSKESTAAETDWASVDDVIEHTATINPGNSGGPLLTEDYQVVGINYAGNDFNQYYAIGHTQAERIIEQLRQGHDVESIGIAGIATAADDGSVSGVWVYSVKAGSVADTAGIKAGDLITHLGGIPLVPDAAGNMTMADYCDILRSHSADAAIDVSVIRWQSGETWVGQINGRPLARQTEPAPAPTVEPSDPGPGPAPDPAPSQALVDVGDDAIAFAVPASWSQVATGNLSRFDGARGHVVFAALDVEQFQRSFAPLGVMVAAWHSTTVSADQILDAYSFADSCDETDPRVSVSGDLGDVVYEMSTGCEDTSTLVVQMAIETSDYTARLIFQSDAAQADVLDVVLDTLTIVSSNLPVTDCHVDAGVSTCSE
jgi:serine protease Do